MDIVELLKKKYSESGFNEILKEPPALVFSKIYFFTDHDNVRKEVTIEVKYNMYHLFVLPEVTDPNNILTSMHSINGYQCWARYTDIFPQVGLGVIGPDFIEQQIKKLISAHIRREYYTVNESPEFAASFKARNKIEHNQFYVSPEILSKVVGIGKGKILSCMANYIPGRGYLAAEFAGHDLIIINPETGILIDNPTMGKNRRVYFLNMDYVPHFDWRSDITEFLYALEIASGLQQDQTFIQNIREDIFLVVVFYNKDLGHDDIVAFRKNDKELNLLVHARVSTFNVFFNRHKEEWSKLIGKKVAILGVGAIGSVLGSVLLQCGIEQLYITDYDYVEFENISRSVYGLNDVGTLKTDAFKRFITAKDVELGERVTIIPKGEDIKNIDLDLVVICIGDLYQEYLFSRMYRAAGFEKLAFVYGQNDCRWGAIYFQDSPHLGCQHCLVLRQQEDDRLKMPYIPYFAEAVGCGNPSYISSPLDINLLANLAGKLIIERLTQEGGKKPNYFIWQSNPDPSAWTDSHSEQFSLKKYRVERHEECDCKNLF